MPDSSEAAEIRYRRRKYGMSTLETIGVLLWVLPALVSFSIDMSVEAWLTDPSATLQTVLFVVRTALLVVSVLGGFLTISAYYFWQAKALSLRRDGLVIERGRRRQRWAWSEISQVRVQPLKRRAVSRLGSKLLLFEAPDPDIQSRLLRWHFGISSAGPVVVIEDIYDTPIDEIAARLNEYRAEAVPTMRGPS